MTAAPPLVAAELGAGPLAQVACRRLGTVRDGATAALVASSFPGRLAESARDLLTLVPVTGDVAGYRPVGSRRYGASGSLRLMRLR